MYACRLSAQTLALLSIHVFCLCTLSGGLTPSSHVADDVEELLITAPGAVGLQLSQSSASPLRSAETSRVRTLVTTAYNTAVFVPCHDLVDYKVALLSKLAKVSPYPIVVGYDVSDTGAIPPAQLAMLEVALRGAIYEPQIVHMSYGALLPKYGDKISNYLGVYQTNPAKLGIMDWFNSSRYSHLWHLEDDMWAPGLDTIISEWQTAGEDLIIKDSSRLPSWASGNWRIGNRSMIAEGRFVYCNPSAFRMSRRFARSVLQTIQDSSTTNHHELWFPYVVERWGLSWTSLLHAGQLRTNARSLGGGVRCLDEVQDSSILLAHPIKCMRHHQQPT